MRDGLPRVFIGLTEIAGYYGSLTRALDAIGVPVTFVALDDHPFDYAVPSGGPVVRVSVFIARRRKASISSGRLDALFWKGLHRLWRFPLFVWALARHDAFIFGFATTFFRFRELSILKFFGKRVIFVFNGSDARPSYIDGAEMASSTGRSVGDCVELVRRKKASMRRIEAFADAIVIHPLYAHLFEGPVVAAQIVGLPGPLRSELPAPDVPLPDAPVRIVHSPSQPEAKGTARVREAIERLKAEGLPIEYIELVGVPNRIVLEELRRCHFVIDQVYSDAPMPGFAREAASYAKPAVVGSYGWDEIRRVTPPAYLAPVQACHPDDLESSIRLLVADPPYRRHLGADARRFVETQWDSEAVARRYLRIIAGDVPAEWRSDPSDIRYVHGSGLSQARVRSIVTDLLDTAGPQALQLDDKPALRNRFITFAREREP